MSKTSVLDTLLQPSLYPDLYSEIFHKVRIEYYPPRRRRKEGWDNIDIFGWCGMPMQIKINFLCRDSVLAAPIVLDLALFLDLAQRAGMGGVQEVVVVLFQSADVATRLEARARSLHSTPQAPEHPSHSDGRRRCLTIRAWTIMSPRRRLERAMGLIGRRASADQRNREVSWLRLA